MSGSRASFSTVNVPYHLASVSPQFIHMKNNSAVVILSREGAACQNSLEWYSCLLGKKLQSHPDIPTIQY